jgi:hypothetical protein
LEYLYQKKNIKKTVTSAHRAIDLFLAALPVGKLLLRFVRGDPVPFLDVQGELLTVACDHVNVGKLAPASLEAALSCCQPPSMQFHFISVSLQLIHDWHATHSPAMRLSCGNIVLLQLNYP